LYHSLHRLIFLSRNWNGKNLTIIIYWHSNYVDTTHLSSSTIICITPNKYRDQPKQSQETASETVRLGRRACVECVSLLNSFFFFLQYNVLDKWIWKHDLHVGYYVKDVYSILNQNEELDNDFHNDVILNIVVHLKVLLFAWKLINKWIRTNDTLIRHGVFLSGWSVIFTAVFHYLASSFSVVRGFHNSSFWYWFSRVAILWHGLFKMEACFCFQVIWLTWIWII